MKRTIFGTDGIRGKTNEPPITPDIIMRLAITAGRHFTRGNHRHIVVIGKDTRLSGYMIEPALTAGFISVGMDVVLVGPLPTPAIAMLTRSLRADLGVVISASHNPYEDNGIKFFGPDGHKLSDQVEEKIEQDMKSWQHSDLSSPRDLGKARRLDDAQGRYIEHVKSTFPKHLRLDGLKIVVDCAHGAAYQVAPAVLWELGAEIISLGVKPDGFNINQDCGATSPDTMIRAVLEHNADLGIALDGDADRLIMADEKGNLINGDSILGIIASYWQKKNSLQSSTIVGTVMSNLGLERYLTTKGLNLHRTPVGDRYISQYMREHKCNLGGEQSGHMILKEYATTGDGLVAALQVLAYLVEEGKPVSAVTQIFPCTPQILRNIKITGTNPLENSELKQYIEKQSLRMQQEGGRMLVRESGTEPLLRIMLEGEDLHHLTTVANETVEMIERLKSKI